MKTLLPLILLSQISLFSIFSSADNEIVNIKFNSFDSLNINKILSRVSSKTISRDSENPDTIIGKTTFTTSNQAFGIDCTSTRFASDETNECDMNFDFNRSQTSETLIQKGAIGNVIIATVFNQNDNNKIFRALNGMPYFQSLEKVLVSLPNGNTVQLPRTRIECQANGLPLRLNGICTISAFTN